MPAPPSYDRQANFVEYAAAHTSEPYNPADHDAECDAIEQTLDQIVSNLSLIQRDDGALANQCVTTDSLSAAVAALLAVSGSTIRGAWVTATAYAVRDVVTEGTGTYVCATAHTAGTFATDLAAAKWVLIYSSSGYAASAITNTPAGNVAATNVQAAINELDTEKLAKASNLGDVADRPTAFANLVAGGGTMTGALAFSGAAINEAQGADIASAATINLDSATGNHPDITGTTAISAVTLAQGRTRLCRAMGVFQLTNSASLVVQGNANFTTTTGDYLLFIGRAASVVEVRIFKADGTPVGASTAYPPGHIKGLGISTAGGSATLTVAAGYARDAADSANMVLSASISKTTGGWAVGTGNGGLDTGTIKASAIGATCTFATSVMTCTVAPTSGTFAVGQCIHAEGMPAGTFISSLGTGTGGTGTYNLSTSPGTLGARTVNGLMTYHVYEIRRPDTGVVDVCVSASASAPTTGGAIPAAYTQYRRIGSWLTDGSANWLKINQNGDRFELDVMRSTADANSTNPGMSAVLRSLFMPSGIKLEAIVAYASVNGSNNHQVLLTDPDTTDTAPTGAIFSWQCSSTGASTAAGRTSCITNTAGQVRTCLSASGASDTLVLNCVGWIDRRGKD